MDDQSITRFYDLKVVLLGESSVGKSSIVTRYINGKFLRNNATIGAAFSNRKIELGSNKIINLEIWDTAGQERYRSLTPMYYRNSNVALIVFDVTDQNSLLKTHSWITELNKYMTELESSKIEIIIVANKIDLLDQESTEELLWDISKEYKVFNVSAKTGYGINELFKYIIDNVTDDRFYVADDSSNDPVKLSRSKVYPLNTSSCQC